jgi:hypothetical protein
MFFLFDVLGDVIGGSLSHCCVHRAHQASGRLKMMVLCFMSGERRYEPTASPYPTTIWVSVCVLLLRRDKDTTKRFGSVYSRPGSATLSPATNYPLPLQRAAAPPSQLRRSAAASVAAVSVPELAFVYPGSVGHTPVALTRVSI